MEIKRYAEAHWNGDIKTGKGSISTPQSGILENADYDLKGRYETMEGASPEELIAAAHAGCLSSNLSIRLGKAGFPPEKIDVRAQVVIASEEDPKISRIELEVRAAVPNIDAQTFLTIAENASKNCPVSKMFASGLISLDAELVGK